MINKHYGRDLGKMKMLTSQQLVDGSTVEFVDPVLGVSYASARLRHRNKLLITEQGDLLMSASVSDIVYAHNIRDEDKQK